MRPKKGIVKVRNHAGLETQVDVSSGDILLTSQRRNDFVVKMHDFSAWHARLWLGVPVRLAFLALFVTGVYLNIKMQRSRFKSLPLTKMLSKKPDKPDNLGVSQNTVNEEKSDSTPSKKKDGRPWRVYIYPDKGITTIRAKNRQEFQIDSTTGEVLQVAVRRTDWLEDVHEGKWKGLNLWLFLPVHILSLILWLTGTIVAYSR